MICGHATSPLGHGKGIHGHGKSICGPVKCHPGHGKIICVRGKCLSGHDVSLHGHGTCIICHAKCPSRYVKVYLDMITFSQIHAKCYLEHGERIYVHDTRLLGHG
jgi:hypothetical protein